MPGTTLKIRIVACIGGHWQLYINRMPIGHPVREPLVELAARLIQAGLAPTAPITMTQSRSGPCRASSTLGEVLTSPRQHGDKPFRAPEWHAAPSNGAH